MAQLLKAARAASPPKPRRGAASFAPLKESSAAERRRQPAAEPEQPAAAAPAQSTEEMAYGVLLQLDRYLKVTPSSQPPEATGRTSARDVFFFPL